MGESPRKVRSVGESIKQTLVLGFPDSSVGKEFACNTEDLGWIPGLGRSLGEGLDYPLSSILGSAGKECGGRK